MTTFKITLAYDGAGFVGWQRQASGMSIQKLIEDALADLDGRDVAVAGAGRTDAGVHALGQVAGFSLERAIAPDTLARALNARLPETVRVVAAEEVPPRFHARFDARWKTYRYRLWHGRTSNPFERQYAWHVSGALDVAAMAAAARLVEGRHDFAGFQGAGSDPNTTEREVFSSRIVRSRKLSTTEGTEVTEAQTGLFLRVPRVLCGGELIQYEIAGDGFLRHMVRNIVGTLVEIGRGRRSVESIGEVLASRDRARAGPTAPAEGLFLVHVAYDEHPRAPATSS